MPRYCFIIRGTWDEPRDDYAGFFTSRVTRAETLNEAAAQALELLSHEWESSSFLPHGGKGLKLAIVDGWQIGWLVALRRKNKGHTFYASDDADADAASIEAQVARAPRDSSIWCLSSPPSSGASDYHLLD